MRVVSAIAIVLALVGMPAHAGDFEDGEKLLKSKDYPRAIISFRKAAEQGNADAQVNLGSLYAEGKGVARDYKQAVMWYQKAAAQGYTAGQISVGFMYEEGHGVSKDYKQAAYWYEKAAAQGDVIAQSTLFFLYSDGVGKDNIEARKWAIIADSNSMPGLRQLHEVVEQQMTREQIAEAQRRASQWMKAHK